VLRNKLDLKDERLDPQGIVDATVESFGDDEAHAYQVNRFTALSAVSARRRARTMLPARGGNLRECHTNGGGRISEGSSGRACG
jgi:hypothetical protein